MFNNWLFYVFLYLIFAVIFNESYKLCTIKMKSAAAITILLEFIAGMFSLILIPIFKMKLPTDPKIYFFLGIAIIFYAIQDRLATTARSGMDASVYSIIKQLSTVFMILLGLLFFKEKFVLNKILGAVLILISNILVFYKRGTFKINKYIIFGIIANLCLTIALFLDVNFSEEFNLAIYVAITLLFPAFLVFVFERIKLREIIKEYKYNDKKMIFLTSLSWTLMMIVKLKAYQLGKVTLVAPLCSLTVIITVVVGYLFFNEKENLIKKVISAILILISVILIKI